MSERPLPILHRDRFYYGLLAIVPKAMEYGHAHNNNNNIIVVDCDRKGDYINLIRGII